MPTIRRRLEGRVATCRGFTLIELLIVVAILVILLTMAATQTAAGLESMKMRQAVETTRYAMEQARQLAMTRNHGIMFRFYEDPAELGAPAWNTMEFGVAEIITDPSDPGYVAPGSTGFQPRFKRLGSVERLPGGLVFHPSNTFSTLVGNDAALLRGTETAPESGAIRRYTAFVYQPDGRCPLPPGSPWTLTIVKEQEATVSLPANYATLQLDPRTARVRLYRP